MLGVGVARSRIFPEGDNVRGHTEHEDDDRTDADSLTRRAWIALAGPAAQERYAPEWQLDGARPDLNHASWCLASIPKPGGGDWTSDEDSIREDRAAREARRLVNEHWPA